MVDDKQQNTIEEVELQEKTFMQKLKNPLTYLILAWVGLGVVLTAVMKVLDVHNAMSTAWTIPNFLILCSFLWYFARVPLADFLAQRRADILEGLDKAEKMKTEAEARHEEYQQRLDNIDKEIQKLREMALEESKLEKQKIIDEANRQADRIKNDAEFTAQQELKKAQAMLRAETAALSVKLAEGILTKTIDDNDRNRLLDEYLERVEAGQ